MFSKAKRFDPASTKSEHKDTKKPETSTQKQKQNIPASLPRCGKPINAGSHSKCNSDDQSECGSIRSNKSAFATPKPAKFFPSKLPTSNKKEHTYMTTLRSTKKPANKTASTDLAVSQEIEIRNKDYTIAEYGQQIEELKNEIAILQNNIKNSELPHNECSAEIEHLNEEIQKVKLNQDDKQGQNDSGNCTDGYNKIINELQSQLETLQKHTLKLEDELQEKQIELSSMESLICVRDGLCQDLQNKLMEKEAILEETRQRLEMVNGHHALAMEANESIRREYKIELECLKTKLEEEKQAIMTKCKTEQESIKNKYTEIIANLRNNLELEKLEAVGQLEQKIKQKDNEMNAKLDQLEERAHEKLRLCEIQYEQRTQSVQEHWTQQQEKLKHLEVEVENLKYTLSATNEQRNILQAELNHWKNKHDTIQQENFTLTGKVDDLEESSKEKSIDYENEKNILRADMEKILKEKQKFEMSLTVTRDIVQVLSMRLRESDNELDSLESKFKVLSSSKQDLEEELAAYKNTLNNTFLECNEYKEALVNILKSKAALAKEHNRIMEHNVTLIESLQNVEKEAYKELGTIKEEMVDDVEMLKMESKSQIQKLRDEVEKKKALVLVATEHARQATVAAEQSRLLVQQAAHELERIERENSMLKQQICDQQSLAVEVSLLRQENEELTMTLAKQSSIIDKIKKDSEQLQLTPKSPSLHRKSLKVGKENAQIISPLRERNH